MTSLAALPRIVADGELRCSISTGVRGLGWSELIERSKRKPVPVEPGGVLGDYVRFYFTPFTPFSYHVARRSDREEHVLLESRVSAVADLQRDRWFVDETYVKVAGRWRYVYRAIDQHRQIIDVHVSARRDTRAARRFFATALRAHGEPVEVVTDRAPALRAAIDELIPGVFHNTEQYANNRVECDHGRLKTRLRPMRGLKREGSARVIIRGHAFMQNIRRGHFQLRVEVRARRRVEHAFTELARTI